jgi:hypothetical protein
MPSRKRIHLHSFKTLNAVVKDLGRRVELEGRQGVDGRGVPACVDVPSDLEHVVRAHLPKQELRQGWFRLHPSHSKVSLKGNPWSRNSTEL